MLKLTCQRGCRPLSDFASSHARLSLTAANLYPSHFSLTNKMNMLSTITTAGHTRAIAGGLCAVAMK